MERRFARPYDKDGAFGVGVVMYKKILVPMDGSERAELILPHVKAYARQHESLVIFLQVLEPGVIDTNPFDVNPEMTAKAARERAMEISAYLGRCEEDFQSEGIKTEQRVLRGPVVAVILDVAQSAEVDLVALASHGRTGLSRVFYGSIAAGVLNRIDRPLFLIRSN
jgi:nucleotide-binding universal stress UspA family protein